MSEDKLSDMLDEGLDHLLDNETGDPSPGQHTKSLKQSWSVAVLSDATFILGIFNPLRIDSSCCQGQLKLQLQLATLVYTGYAQILTNPEPIIIIILEVFSSCLK